MLEFLFSLLTRLLGVRLLNQATQELLDGLDQAEARAGTPARQAIIEGHHQAMSGLLNGQLPPPAGTAAAAAPHSQLPPPGSPPAAGVSLPSPLSEPAPVATPPVPRRPRRPRKLPIESPSSNGVPHHVSHP